MINTNVLHHKHFWFCHLCGCYELRKACFALLPLLVLNLIVSYERVFYLQKFHSCCPLFLKAYLSFCPWSPWSPRYILICQPPQFPPLLHKDTITETSFFHKTNLHIIILKINSSYHFVLSVMKQTLWKHDHSVWPVVLAEHWSQWQPETQNNLFCCLWEQFNL